MSAVDYGNILRMKWNICKTKLHNLTRKDANRELNEREKVLQDIQDLGMLIIEKPSLIGQMENERRAEWASKGGNIGHGFVDMRRIFVQRTQLSWTGLYGKAPWPRERKVWDKV